MVTTPIAPRNDRFDTMRSRLPVNSLGYNLDLIIIQPLHSQDIRALVSDSISGITTNLERACIADDCAQILQEA